MILYLLENYGNPWRKRANFIKTTENTEYIHFEIRLWKGPKIFSERKQSTEFKVGKGLGQGCVTTYTV